MTPVNHTALHGVGTMPGCPACFPLTQNPSTEGGDSHPPPPSFSELRKSIEEFHDLVHVECYRKKRKMGECPDIRVARVSKLLAEHGA